MTLYFGLGFSEVTADEWITNDKPHPIWSELAENLLPNSHMIFIYNYNTGEVHFGLSVDARFRTERPLDSRRPRYPRRGGHSQLAVDSGYNSDSPIYAGTIAFRADGTLDLEFFSRGVNGGEMNEGSLQSSSFNIARALEKSVSYRVPWDSEVRSHLVRKESRGCSEILLRI